MSRVGRRTLYLYGSITLFGLVMFIDLTAIALLSNIISRWVIGSMLLLFTLIYDLTVGWFCFSLVAEVSSTRLKTKTIVLARNFYKVGGIVVNVLTTYRLTPSVSGWG